MYEVGYRMGLKYGGSLKVFIVLRWFFESKEGKGGVKFLRIIKNIFNSF